MKSRIVLLFLLIFASSYSSWAGIVKGTVTDQSGEALPYANVYVKNTTYGVATDLNGRYFLELKTGKYILVFSYMGYNTAEHQIIISDNKPLIFNVSLSMASYLTEEILISPDKRDITKRIVQNARDRRRENFEAIQKYSCNTYLISTLEVRTNHDEGIDSTLATDSILQKQIGDLEELTGNKRLNLIESLSETYYFSPSSVKEKIIAYHDYSDKAVTFEQTISAQFSYGPQSVAPVQAYEENSSLIYKDLNSCHFDFYANQISYPSLCQQPLLSPLAYNSGLSYSYELEGSFYQENQLIYKILVKPLSKTSPLFEGVLFIEDSSYALIGVDLFINRAAMLTASDFRIIQNYEKINGFYVPVRREITYSINDFDSKILGNTRISHSDYRINFIEKIDFSANEQKKFAIDAFDKDSSFWNNQRVITLKDEEMAFIYKSDSIQKYYASDIFLDKRDSAFNRIGWYTPFTGIGRSNHRKGYQFYVNGILSQINIFGIGGYRHNLSGYYNQRFKNNNYLQTEEFIDYGFTNKDIKYKIGIGYTYKPVKFLRTFIRVGDYYEWINDYASFEQIFSRSNYVRTQTVSIAQRMEIINGLFAEVTLMYSFQTPIKNLIQDKWSDSLFGKINEPIDFDPYKKVETKINIEYRIGQKFYIKNNRKFILENEYPTLTLVYRKGFPGILGSEVDFDYLEMGGKDDFRFARWGTIRWEFSGGWFINKNKLRLIEYKYFRGSDRGFFSDPLNSFQLLGPSLNTSNSYFKAAFIHHFERSITNKIPLVNRLKLDIAFGAGTLLIPDNNFSHAEMFAGIERIFRIKDQLIRLGIYAVTSDNTLENADFTWKFGFDFYNSYIDKWNY